MRIPTLFLVILISGCTSFDKPPPDADYGVPPKHYKQMIPIYFTGSLPPSAIRNIGLPEQGYRNKGLAFGGKVTWYGWMVQARVHNNNMFGTPSRDGLPYLFFFDGEEIIGHEEKGHTLITGTGVFAGETE